MSDASENSTNLIDLSELFPSISGQWLKGLIQEACPQSDGFQLPRLFNLDMLCGKIAYAVLPERSARVCDVFPVLNLLTDETINKSSLSVRTRTCLRDRGIRKWKDVLTRTIDDLFKIKNMGKRSVSDFLALAARVSLTKAHETSANSYPLRSQESSGKPVTTEQPYAEASVESPREVSDGRDNSTILIDLSELFSSISKKRLESLIQVVCPDADSSRLTRWPTSIDMLCGDIAYALLPDRYKPFRELLPLLYFLEDEPIDQNSLSVRTGNYLLNDDIRKWGDVLTLTIDDLFGIRNMGKTSVLDFLTLAARVSLPKAHETATDSYPARSLESSGEPGQTSAKDDVSTKSPVKDALKNLARWAILELSAVQVGDVCKLARNLPDDIAKDWNEIKKLPLEVLSGVYPNDVGELIEDCLERINTRDSEVFLRRVSFLDRVTLEEIGQEHGISRERVRQLESKAVDQMRSFLAERRYAPIGWRAHSLRRKIGLGVPYDSQYCRTVFVHALRDIAADFHECALTVFLWFAGPYRVHSPTGWLTRGPLPGCSILEDVTDGRGVLDLETLFQMLEEEGLVPEVHSDWIEQIDSIRTLDGKSVNWTGSVTDKAALILECWGKPATPEEINLEIGEGHGGRATRNRLFEDNRFMRIDLERVALRKWGLEEYSGIAEEIGQEIDRTSGRVRIETLVANLVSQFSLREQSVRVYLKAPMFVIEGDSIRRRTEQDTLDLNDSLTEIRGCYLVANHRLNLRIQVTPDILRGSGAPLPEPVAIWLGLSPGKRQPLQCGDRSVLVSWSETSVAGPSLGSIREAVTRGGCKEGHEVILCFAKDTMTLELLQIAPSDLKASAATNRLCLLTGLALTGDQQADRKLLRSALALESSGGSITGVLRSRGEHQVAHLVNENIPADLDEAIDRLGKLL